MSKLTVTEAALILGTIASTIAAVSMMLAAI